jgi:hypothetical protein
MCPRCLSLKLKITEVGTKMDMCNCVKLARIDNDARQFDIETVRKMLFKKGINITSVKIDRILGPTSAAPTRVHINLFYLFKFLIMPFLKFPNTLVNTNSTFIGS